MNLSKLIYRIGCIASLMGATAVFSSCNEEKFDVPDYTVIGEDVTLKLDITLPVMDTKTRADLDEASLNQVESLWIRTYSADTGKATSDWYKAEEQPGFSGNVGREDPHPVTIKTLSGSSYIVAVANVDNLGVTKDNIANRLPLRDLLEDEAADTWAGFLNIAVVAPSNAEGVRAPVPPLPMAGCFSDIIVGGDHPEPSRIDEWQTKDFQPYFIPVKKGGVDFTTTGAIHLRRLVSHLNFNVVPGNDNIEVTVNSYQVMNAPRFTWLYERPNIPGVLVTNFGDLANDESDAAKYYADVPQYGSQFVTENADGSSSFDFWQAENKHIGTAEKYSDRDLKNDTLYTNLTGDTWTPNNEASYVLIQCTVDYKNPLNVNQQGEEVAGGTQVYRSGEVTYIVHLGYVGDGNESDKAKDFNCFRNVDYTYNLTVKGLNDIRVDAHATNLNPETYHGEEGLVVDLANATIDIDAHYTVFNIQLTEEELSGDFGFIITAYENGNQITVTDANTQRGVGSSIEILDRDETTVIDPKYYNWIELRPTTGQNVLAEYKPRYGGNSDGKTFLLADLKAPINGNTWDIMSDDMKSTTGWYTVFVNEYTYEPTYTGNDGYANEQWDGTNGRPNWMGYVNQNPRRFYIRVTQSTSPDGNSLYARSKYGISQQSLMTYYSDQDFAPADGTIPPGTAIAVERVNETMGMNLVHSFGGGTSTENGRWNVAQWLNGEPISENNLSINNTNQNMRPQWSNYIQSNILLNVGEVVGMRAQGGIEYPARTFNIPGVMITNSGANYSWSDPQPNNNYRIEAINACMSRNRDNNGNGRIEPDELRWYVPAMSQYLQMMIGTKALPDPLMEYAKITQLPRVNNTSSFSYTSGEINNNFYSRYMYVSSNNGTNVLWAVEGTSLSTYGNVLQWSGNASHPWQVRCIRNLGANLTTVTKDNKVSNTYTHDATNRTFSMPYFGGAAFRANSYASNGTGVGQMPNHTINSNYNRVYYGFEYAANDITVDSEYRNAGSIGTYIYTNPCQTRFGNGWRVPNQVELSLICDAGLLSSTNNSAIWISCTTNYFAHTDGVGNDDLTNKYFLGSIQTNGTQANPNNIGYAAGQVFVRCVRDRNQ